MKSRTARVGIVGAGNCASSFVQGLTYYHDARDEEPVPRLMHASLGPYRVRDVEIASAFDIHAGKVGRDLADALRCAPNNTRVFADIAPTGVTVARGPTLDGIGAYLRDDIPESPQATDDVAAILKRTGTEIAKLALDKKLGGALVGPASYFMKVPPQQFPDHLACELTLEFIRLYGAADEPLPLRRVPADRGQVEHDYSIRARSARDVRAD